MENENLITVAEFCDHYKVEYSFIHSLTEFGLVEITTIKETPCIDKHKIVEIEPLIRLHYDLEINMEGIDVISNLLEKVKELQSEVSILKSRLRFYEGS